MEEEKGLARNTDPATSHAAAGKVNIPRLQRVVLEALRNEGEMTMSEMARCSGEERDSLSPRMKKLVERGLVVDTGRTRVPERFGLAEARANKENNAKLIPTTVLKRKVEQTIYAITEAGKALVA